MLQDITIGQYYPTNSIIHRLDPRVKLLFTFVFMVSLFITDSFASYIFIIAVLMGVISITKIPFIYIFRGIKAIFYLLILTFLLNMLFTQGGKIYFEYGFLKITHDGQPLHPSQNISSTIERSSGIRRCLPVSSPWRCGNGSHSMACRPLPFTTCTTPLIKAG